MSNQDWESLQSSLMLYYNRMVRESFRTDIDEAGDTPESFLLRSCLIKDNDTAPMVSIKMLNFFFARNGYGKMDEIIYGIPVSQYDESVVYRPQVTLFFEETQIDYEQRIPSQSQRLNTRKKRVQVSFRYMNETQTTFNQAEVNRLKNELRTTFPLTYKFKTGRAKLSYRDKPNGYELIISPYTETEGRELITKVLALRNNTPDWELSTVSKSNRNYNTTERQTILGKSYKKPSRRQIAEVKLKKATLHLQGLPKPIILLDRFI